MAKSTNESNRMFEIATRNHLRFASVKGQLSVEELWDVPLRSRDDLNLNSIAKTVNAQLQKASEENFVESISKSTSVERKKQELALEIVKHVIQTKLDEEQEAAQSVAKAAEKSSLLKALAEKKAGALSEMSEKDLLKRIAELE